MLLVHLCFIYFKRYWILFVKRLYVIFYELYFDILPEHIKNTSLSNAMELYTINRRQKVSAVWCAVHLPVYVLYTGTEQLVVRKYTVGTLTWDTPGALVVWGQYQ